MALLLANVQDSLGETISTITEDAAELSNTAIIPVGETLLSASAASARTDTQKRETRVSSLPFQPPTPCKIISNPVLFSLHFVHSDEKPRQRSGCKMVLVTVAV